MLKTMTLLVVLGLASFAQAQEFKAYTTDEAFGDVAFALENAILAKGLVIDHIAHTGEMLERTRSATGSDKVLYLNADVYLFCSAAVSRQVMEADPANFNFCPYAIRLHEMPENPGTVIVSHQSYSGTMAPVEELMESIVKDALGQ
ncbi:DUF302 domain-containing protein [Pseudorhodobacter sp.]|uniref:DUF302 domain-containing protein n=1 Tax=Pseudorhodobacter sp. TaxID=1934400 RepID=UPI0026484119|nr:DUF302 domain-containing protein [Pseudorhodobacter sp.]MDN5786225.1 DUF302 domain-containing protein [Pseudorhodobacter sp.]